MTDNTPKTIYSLDNRILFYKLEHFISDIVNGKCCFICGALPDSKEFNDEHIIPDWILRKFNLHSQKITLPNLSKIQYSKYKVPCCKECNSELGKHFEEPISELLSKSYDEIASELSASVEKRDLLFRWLCLIYFKTHLKDKSLRENLDKRVEDKKIGDIHWWEDFHHIHCIVRSHHTNAQLHPEVYGSIYVNQIIQETENVQFDYIDNPWSKGVLLQLGDFCVASILDDSAASISIYHDQISSIKGNLTAYQFYEVFSHLNFIRLHLKERPEFQSSINRKTGYNIIAKRPEKIELVDEKERTGTFGDFLRLYVERTLGKVENREEVLKEIEEGKRSFLWDEKGDFNNMSEEKN
jgi:hypothetical protein|tara:strand:+ start:11 stop:1072 length:1062 start_codon:yes stop_codon:yes gene_type:complete